MGFAVANNVVLNHTHEKVDLALNRLHTLAHLRAGMGTPPNQSLAGEAAACANYGCVRI